MRQFIAKTFPSESGRLALSYADSKYLRSVLRLTEGTRVSVRLPDERLFDMALAKDKDGWSLADARISAKATIAQNVFDAIDCALFQFLPKSRCMDSIVRQMTECGARFIVPVIGSFSPKNDAQNKMERWNKIIREARQQSASPVPTEILEPLVPRKALDWWALRNKAGNAIGVLLNETEGSASLNECLAACGGKTPKTAAIAVGAEGGMSGEERALFVDAGFSQAHFATNILKVDTAALYGMAALQTALFERGF
jgi:16S rRNA (uracil1498-N3)-methyltransferase